jgi:hypothetical protein
MGAYLMAFLSNRNPGLLGAWSNTPGIDDDMLRRLGMYGDNAVVGISRAAPPALPGAPGSLFQPALPNFSPDEKRVQLPDSTNQPRPPVDARQAGDLSDLVGQAPERNRFGTSDILAGVLAALGDALAQQGGGKPFATKNLGKVWADRGDAFTKKQDAYQQRQRMAALPGMDRREMLAAMVNPQAWSNHMADAATSRYQAATLNPGDQRYLGEGHDVYQAPTRGQLYAQSLDLDPGSQQYNDALRDQELGANGPTGFRNSQTLQDARNAQAFAMEAQRQRNRLGMEAARQTGRQALRGTPSYRDLNPPARQTSGAGRRTGVPTATGANGEKYELRSGKWVQVQ